MKSAKRLPNFFQKPHRQFLYAAEHDPFCYPDTNILINKAGFKDQARLDEYETAVMLIRWEEEWPDGGFDPDHFRRLHHHFFQDVYEWAGTYREVRIAKGDSMFCYPESIDNEMTNLFSKTRPGQIFHSESISFIAKHAAHFLSELNAIHPFREGNGRTQLAFLALMANSAARSFIPNEAEAKEVKKALIESFSGSEERLEKTLQTIIA